jgi:antitoxin component YwqK of YwqJK toxin-antitoxin module
LIVDKEKDKEYLMEIKRVVYYKGSPLTGKLVEYYHSDGEGRLPHEDGYSPQLFTKTNYVDGLEIGINEKFWENGQLKYRVNYIKKENKMTTDRTMVIKDGIEESYYKDGLLEYKGGWVNGSEDGIHEKYYKNSQLEFKGIWINKKKEGRHERYHKNGQEERISNYKNGKLIDSVQITYKENGEKSLVQRYKNGKLHGRWEEYYDGVISTSEWIDGSMIMGSGKILRVK